MRAMKAGGAGAMAYRRVATAPRHHAVAMASHHGALEFSGHFDGLAIRALREDAHAAAAMKCIHTFSFSTAGARPPRRAFAALRRRDDSTLTISRRRQDISGRQFSSHNGATYGTDAISP